MAIEVELPDGTVVEFPDGTSNAVMEDALKNYAMQQPAQELPVQDMAPVQAQMPTPEDIDARVAAALKQMTDAQSGLQNFGIGAGRSVDAGLRGLKQAFTGGLLGQSAAASGALRKLGFNEAADALNRNIGAPLARSSVEQQALADERKLIDAPLLDTKAGLTGNIAGTAAQLIGPGVLARGTAAGAALLPRTIGGNAFNGAALGYLQPVASDESRGLNTVVGGVAGGAASAGANAIGAGVRGAASRIRGLLSPAEQVADSAPVQAAQGLLSSARPGASASTARKAEQEAARLIQAQALDPNSLLRADPSLIPGVVRDLAEESKDAGVAALGRAVRQIPGMGPMFDTIGRQNNSARIAALSQYAGRNGEREAAQAARASATDALREHALQGSVDVSPMLPALDAQIKALRTQPGIQSGVNTIRGLLNTTDEQTGQTVLESNPQMLYGLRKEMGRMLSGKYGGDNSQALAGASEIMAARNGLDDVMGQPFRDYINSYSQLSRPINQIDVFRHLTSPKVGSSVIDTVTGDVSLTPSGWSRAVNDMDKVVQNATKFNKARADQVLDAPQRDLISNVTDDMQRQFFAANAGKAGNNSVTTETGLFQQHLNKALDKIPVFGAVGKESREKQAQFVQEKLAFLLANPAEYRRVAMTLSQPERQALDRALNEAATLAASTASTTAIQ